MLLHSVCQQICTQKIECHAHYASKFGKLSSGHKTQRSVFIPIPRKGNAKNCSKYCTIALIPHTSKTMLKILQARLRHYMNWELPDVWAVFWKGRDQISNCQHSLHHRKTKIIPEKHLLLLLWLCHSLWLCGQQQTVENSSDHLTCLLRNLYAGQEATVIAGHGTIDWFQIEKGERQTCVLSPCLSDLYAEYIMWNAGPDEAQAGIKIAGRNINNLRYADDITLMESEEELKSLFFFFFFFFPSS